MKKVVVAGAGGFMGGMGFIETHKADCMLSVLINAHLLMAARDKGIDKELNGINDIVIWGDGLQTRSFMYIDDCCKRIKEAGPV